MTIQEVIDDYASALIIHDQALEKFDFAKNELRDASVNLQQAQLTLTEAIEEMKKESVNAQKAK